MIFVQVAKLTWFSTLLQNVKGEKGKRLSCKRGNVLIMQVKLASSCKQIKWDG